MFEIFLHLKKNYIIIFKKTKLTITKIIYLKTLYFLILKLKNRFLFFDCGQTYFSILFSENLKNVLKINYKKALTNKPYFNCFLAINQNKKKNKQFRLNFQL